MTADMPRHSAPLMPLLVAWTIALCATLSALFLGEVMGRLPCLLCWYQRIFMFPLAVVLGVGFYQADTAVWRYALPLAGLGGMIAAYHSLVYYGLVEEAMVPCSISGPSCSGPDMAILSGLPIPLLSMAAFSAVAALLIHIARNSP
ncbi:disulfide bond formation protein B [Hyphomicrobium sp.]|uniref:disulfide bond formation protein B n=1 Tax=Hyphomicrobium sp. TaxID=82 RepID=UPI002FE1AF63